MPVAVAAVRMITMGMIVVVTRGQMDVAVIVRTGMGMRVSVTMFMRMRVGMRMRMNEIAVPMLVRVNMGVRMTVTMLMGVLVRFGVIVPMRMPHVSIAVHRPRSLVQRDRPAPITFRATVSPASTVILT